jgi:hypothetical protein
MFTFHEDTHTYYFNESPVPSVSQIINPLCNFENIPLHNLEYASTRGTNVHLACHQLDTIDLDIQAMDDEYRPYLEAYNKFCIDMFANWYLIEEKLFNEELWFAGTIDRLGLVNTTLTLIDIKTSSKIYPHYQAQLGGYYKLLQNNKFGKIEKLMVLKLNKTSKYKLEEFEIDKCVGIFEQCLNIHKWKVQNKVIKF